MFVRKYKHTLFFPKDHLFNSFFLKCIKDKGIPIWIINYMSILFNFNLLYIKNVLGPLMVYGKDEVFSNLHVLFWEDRQVNLADDILRHKQSSPGMN